MPYFSSDGATLYFSSNRGAAGTWAIYKVPYPSTVSGSPGSQSDGAVQLTTPTGTNDYAPTVSADGSEMTFIRCDATNTTCHLYEQSTPNGGTATLVATGTTLRAPDRVSGVANRPEMDPADNSQVLYVGVDNHIHLLSLNGTFSERDLSQESGVGASGDEYPDWNPTGTSVVFDSTRSTGGPAGHTVWSFAVNPAPAVATSLWGTSDPGKEIEPVYAPGTTALVWTTLGNGSNIVEYSPNGKVGNAFAVVNLTQNRTNNSQPAWRPVPPGTALPEAPFALLLPLGALGVAGLAFAVRRRRGTLTLRNV